MIRVRLNDEAKAGLLAAHPAWRLMPEREAITRSLLFPTYLQAIAFINRVAEVADRMDHHPEWSNIDRKIDILLTTHDVGGLSDADAALADEIDGLARGYFGAGSG